MADGVLDILDWTFRFKVSGVEIIVDADDAWVADYSWRLNNPGTSQRYVRRNMRSYGQKKCQLLHRLLSGAGDGFVVDHINKNTADNRKCNLRVCSHAENMRNRKIHKNNSSGYKGVQRYRGLWVAQIRVNGIRYREYGFPTPELAYIAYQKMSMEKHGEFGSS